MDGVIAAAMLDAKSRTSTSGTSTDVSENLTPPPEKKSEPMVRKPMLADASSLEAASSATLLDAFAPAHKTVNSDSATGRGKATARKPPAKGSQPPKKSDNSSVVSNVHGRLGDGSLPPSSSLKNGVKLSIPLTSPPPNQKVMQKNPHTNPQPEEESTSEDGDSDTPKKKPAPISDPNDELDAFLHAPANPSQKSVLEGLPSDSEGEEEEAEREDLEVDEEDDAKKSKGTGHGESKVVARTESSSDGDSDSESVATDALMDANQVGVVDYVCRVKLIIEVQAKVDPQVMHVPETRSIVPSSDLEEEEEPLSQPNKSTNTSTDVVSPVPSSTGPHVTPISNLKSVGRALTFFNEKILDQPDPIDSPYSIPLEELPEDTEDPIQNADTTSTPKPKLPQRAKGHGKTAVVQKSDVGPKGIQSSLISCQNSMLPPPTPSQEVKTGLMLSQPIDQSTPANLTALRKRRPTSQTAVLKTPARSTWTTLPQGERSTRSAGDPAMVDELISSPVEGTSKRSKGTPVKKPASSASVKRTPLFLPGTSQYPIPSSDLPAAEESSSEEEDEEEEKKVIVPPPQRVLRSSVDKNKATTPYRSLSALASQRSIFPSTPIGPAPAADKSQARPRYEEEEEEEEDSGVSESDSPPPSHIPKGRRAGVGNDGRGKRRSQLAMWS